MLLVRWLGMGIGMQSRSQMRASMTLLAILTTVVMSGPIFDYTLDLVGYPLTIAHRSSGTNVTYSMPPLRMLPLLTPGSWLLYLERVFPAAEPMTSAGTVLQPGAVVLLYGAAAIGLRAWILASADAFLGRSAPANQCLPGRTRRASSSRPREWTTAQTKRALPSGEVPLETSGLAIRY